MTNDRYIDWFRDGYFYLLEPEKWNELRNSLDDDFRLSCVNGIRTVKDPYYCGYWHYDEDKQLLFYYDEESDEFKFVTWKDSANGSGSGFYSRRLLEERMGEKKMQARFGAIPCSYDSFYWKKECGERFKFWCDLDVVQYIHDINRCVGPFIGNEVENDVEIENGLWKADVKSAYPACACGKLPDLHNSKLVKGRIDPSKEWPIVFYLKSHHIAEYEKFDTHVDMYHYLYRNFRSKKKNITKYKKEDSICFIDVNDDDEISLCCQYSPYTLKEEFEYFYNLKEQSEGKEKEAAKGVMNFSIGTFDFVKMDDDKKKVAPSKYKYFGHLRAVILARHNHKMIEYYDEIKKKNMEFVCIQTDSLMWRGKESIDSAITDAKNMGELNLEIKNGKGYIHGCGCYWVEDDKNFVEKHQGFVDWGDPQTMEEFKKEINTKHYREWRFNKKTLLMEHREVKLI